MKSLNLPSVSALILLASLKAIGGFTSLHAQILDPVQWTFSAHETDEPGGDGEERILRAEARLGDGR